MLRALATCLVLICASIATVYAKPVRILFVGNELTETADIPARLAGLAKAMGRDATVESITVASYALEDHWRDGRALAAIAKGWDFVVLQQGPSAAPDERVQLVEFARRFAGPIRAAGAKPALFMTWPPHDRRREFPRAIASYRAAAKAVDGVLLPVGEAWLRLLSADKRAALYSGDKNASSLGGDLAILTIWFALFPAGPREFDEAYAAKIAGALDIDPARRDAYLDAATRAIDEPLTLK